MKAILRKSEAAEPFSFIFKDGDKTIVKSENYKAKASAKNGIESVKKNAAEDKRYELKESKNGKFFFNLKSTNGQVIATGMLLATVEDRDAVIANLKANAASAEVEEA